MCLFNFSKFEFTTKLDTMHPWVKGTQVWTNEGPRPSLHIRMLCAKSSCNRHNDMLQELCIFTILHWYCLLLKKDESNVPLPKDALYQILSSTYGEWNKSHAHTIQAYNNNNNSSSSNNNNNNNNSNTAAAATTTTPTITKAPRDNGHLNWLK